MTRFAKFALPAALALAALGAQATELYTPNAIRGGTTPSSMAATPVSPTEVFAPSAVNRFDHDTPQATRTSATTPRDVYAPSIVNRVAGSPVEVSSGTLRSAMQAPLNAEAGPLPQTVQRDVYVGA